MRSSSQRGEVVRELKYIGGVLNLTANRVQEIQFTVESIKSNQASGPRTNPFKD